MDVFKRLQATKHSGNKKAINFVTPNGQHDALSSSSYLPSSTPKIGVGLANLGNTCFMNSVLQLLSHQKDFRNAINNSNHSCHLNSKRFCVICAMKRHLKRCEEATTVFAPKEFAFNLKKIGKQFKLGRQEDSHEFLRYLVEKLNDAIKPSKMIEDIFGGSIASQVTCLTCKNISTVFDPILDLSLDIKNCNSIEQALYRFTDKELLHKNNQYKCEKCNSLRDAHKRLCLGKLPKVLVIQLKRFSSFYRNSSKVNRLVKFPETLDIIPFSTKSKEPLSTYSLTGVLVHSGHTCNSGHYYSYVKPSKSSAWYRMNDEEVTRVGIDHVLSQSAYMLIYEGGASPTKIQANAPVINNINVTPLNSTISWKVERIVPNKGNSKLLNSSLDFRVIETLDAENSAKKSEVKDVKIDKEPLNEKHQNHSESKRNISFLEELQKDESVIPTWNHVATSDKAFKKRVFLEELNRNEKLKRKRASKEDMEYDAPKRKGFKKMREKHNFNFK